MRLLHTSATAGLALAGSLLLAGPAAADSHTGDLNCADFESQAAAQAHYRENTSDPDRLDEDDDGIACENHMEYSDGATDYTPIAAEPAPVEENEEEESEEEESEEMVMPEGGVDTGGGGTAELEHTELLVAGGLALAVGAGGMALMAARRPARD